MRGLEAAALLLLAASASAHGVHDLRGEARLERGRLVLLLPPDGEHREPGRCLRLLDELEVRDSEGRRLPGTRGEGGAARRCVLEYPRTGGAAMSLRLRHAPHRPPRGERLVLALGAERTLVLTGRGNEERIDGLR